MSGRQNLFSAQDALIIFFLNWAFEKYELLNIPLRQINNFILQLSYRYNN